MLPGRVMLITTLLLSEAQDWKNLKREFSIKDGASDRNTALRNVYFVALEISLDSDE